MREGATGDMRGACDAVLRGLPRCVELAVSSSLCVRPWCLRLGGVARLGALWSACAVSVPSRWRCGLLKCGRAWTRARMRTSPRKRSRARMRARSAVGPVVGGVARARFLNSISVPNSLNLLRTRTCAHIWPSAASAVADACHDAVADAVIDAVVSAGADAVLDAVNVGVADAV